MAAKHHLTDVIRERYSVRSFAPQSIPPAASAELARPAGP